ncbi:phage tail protein [Vibrio cholerae]|uniref:phage tail protein n=1 Tax=Vibrio cholerae TaxID=666 RepID=UPI0011D5CDF3|nr:hypothetical protein [Vibrio cholerae]TXX48349.1 hypothetical protein FXF14_11055 [Vibrio cholerae]
MENIQSYSLDFVFNSRKALQKINEFERAVNKKIDNINKRYVEAEKEKQKLLEDVEKLNHKRVSNEEKLAQKELKLKQRQEEALRKKQVRFEAWKTQQLRSASMDRLTLEQKMQVKHLLSAKKTEEEIRDEYKKTTRIMQRENKRRAKMNKNKAGGLGGGVGGGGSKVSAALGGLGIGGVIAGGLTPLTVAAASAAAALMSVASGANQYKELRAGADRAGVSVDYLNRMDFITQGLGQGDEFNREKLADMISDFDERRGELSKDLALNNKGEFTGGEAADLANALKDAGLVKTVDDMKRFVSGSTEEVFGRVLDTTAALQEQGKITDSEARFILESFTSDLGKLGNVYNKNSEQVTQLSKDYEKLGNRITDAQQQKMNEVGKTFSFIGAVFDKFNLNVFKGFSEMLSTTALEGFSEMAAVFSRLAPVIGKIVGIFAELVGLAFKGISPALSLIMTGFENLVNGLTSIVKTIFTHVTEPMAKAFHEIFKTVENLINGLWSWIDGLIKKATSLLPSWMGGSKENTTTSNNTTPTPYNMRQQAVPSYNTGYGYNVPSYTPPDAKVSVARIEESKQQQAQPIQVTVNADREGLAAYVAQSSTFNNSVIGAVYPLWSN